MGQRVSVALESAFFSEKPDDCSKQSEHHMDHNLRFLLGRVLSRQFWNRHNVVMRAGTNISEDTTASIFCVEDGHKMLVQNLDTYLQAIRHHNQADCSLCKD